VAKKQQKQQHKKQFKKRAERSFTSTNAQNIAWCKNSSLATLVKGPNISQGSAATDLCNDDFKPI